MVEGISAVVLLFGALFWVSGSTLAHFLSNKHLWIAFLCNMLGGLCIGPSFYESWRGLFVGLMIGLIWTIITIPAIRLNKYWRDEALKWWNKDKK